MKNNRIKVWCIVIVLMMLAISVGTLGYFYVQQQSKKPEQTIIIDIPQDDIKVSSKPDTEPTEIESKVEAAIVEVVKLDDNEGWLPIESLFDENGLLKEKYYSQKPEELDID